MSTQEFCGAVQHDISAPVERPHQIRGCLPGQHVQGVYFGHKSDQDGHACPGMSCRQTVVLSTITGRPCRFPTSTKASRSTITPPGFAITSQKSALVFASILDSTSDMESASANLASQLNCLQTKQIEAVVAECHIGANHHETKTPMKHYLN